MLGYPHIFIEGCAGSEKDPEEEFRRELRGKEGNDWLEVSGHQTDAIHVLDVECKDSGAVRSNITGRERSTRSKRGPLVR